MILSSTIRQSVNPLFLGDLKMRLRSVCVLAVAIVVFGAAGIAFGDIVATGSNRPP